MEGTVGKSLHMFRKSCTNQVLALGALRLKSRYPLQLEYALCARPPWTASMPSARTPLVQPLI